MKKTVKAKPIQKFDVSKEYCKAINFFISTAPNAEYLFVEDLRALIIKNNHSEIKIVMLRSMNDPRLNDPVLRQQTFDNGCRVAELLGAEQIAASFNGSNIRVSIGDGDDGSFNMDHYIH